MTMDISKLAATSGDVRATPTKSRTVDYDAFLQLLVAQLKNQDPTNPSDGAQFLSQLASFSNVEQAIQMNAKLDAIVTSSMLGEADAIVGRTIQSVDGAVGGLVASVTLADNSLYANLEDGRRVPIVSGVTIA